MSIDLYIYISISIYIYLSIYLSIYLYIYIYIYIYTTIKTKHTDNGLTLTPSLSCTHPIYSVSLYVCEDVRGFVTDWTVPKQNLVWYAGRTTETAVAFVAYDKNDII